jgi:peptidoglycan-N-acetylglucosamine deacetylase
MLSIRYDNEKPWVASLGVVAVAAAGVLLAGCMVAAGRDVTLPVHAVPVGVRMVALSFDDGPDPRWTPSVLALLRRYRARATFFVTGENALAHSRLLRDEVSAGDEVGDHTYSHPYLTRLNAAAVRQQIKEAALAIRRSGAPLPTLFRPPYGLIDRTIERAVQADNLRLILWSVCLERFVNHGPRGLEVARILSRVRPGAIILAHDGGIPDRRRTLAALPLLLSGLERRGYRIVTVGRLLASSRTLAPWRSARRS